MSLWPNLSGGSLRDRDRKFISAWSLSLKGSRTAAALE